MKNKGYKVAIAITAFAMLMVGLAAYLYFSPMPNPVPQTDTQVQSNAELADWKTYRNEEYGFEVRYPSEYVISEAKPDDLKGEVFNTGYLSNIIIGRSDGSFEMVIQPKKNASGGINISNLRNEVMKFYGATSWPFKFPWEDAEIKEFSITGYPAIKSNYGEPREGSAAKDPAVIVYALNAKYLYRVSYIHDIQTGDKMLSTFKFIDIPNVDVSSWKTYRNNEYGFEFRYPPEFDEIEYRIIPGDTGLLMNGVLISPTGGREIFFHGLTRDFSWPKGSDDYCPVGYYNDNGRYYADGPGGREIHPNSVIDIDDGRAKALLMHGAGESSEDTRIIVCLNLPNSVFPGLEFTYYKGVGVNGVASNVDRSEQFKKIISTIKFLK